MSSLRAHAKRELELAGFNGKDSAYGGALAPAVMRLIEVHAKEGHSGGSHHAVLSLFAALSNFKVLSPLTNDPAEWMDVSDHYDRGGPKWQSRRQPSCFSDDGGKTYYDVDEKKVQDKRPIHKSIKRGSK
jgi:hypothetical protein